MDLVFGFLADTHEDTGILVFVNRFSKMVHLDAVPISINASVCARVFIDTVFRLHGLPRELVSDRYPRFTAEFWRSMFKKIGKRLKMCPHVTIQKQITRSKVSTVFLQRSFEGTSIILRK